MLEICQKIQSVDDIENICNSLDTGDIMVTSTSKFTSGHSFIIQVGCNSPWTHTGIIIVLPNSNIRYLLESTNETNPNTTLINPITNSLAASRGVRLIPLNVFLKKGWINITGAKNKENYVNIGFIKLRNAYSNLDFQKRLITFAQTKELYEKTYPTSFVPLIESWWDGWRSLFVPCGCYTTMEIDEMNYTLASKKMDLTENVLTYQEFFCSELVIAALKFTNYFCSPIPASEWTVADISDAKNLNKNLHGVEYQYERKVFIFSA